MDFYHHDDDDSDNAGLSNVMDSSDDDDENEEGGDHDHPHVDVHDDDVDIGFRNTSSWRGKSSERNKNEALYGVFYESDNSNDDDETKNRRRRTGGGIATSRINSTNAPPVFVAAKKPDVIEETSNASVSSMFVKETQKENDETKKTATASSKQSSLSSTEKEKEEQDETESEPDREERLKAELEQKQADDYFLSLLNKAKEAKNRRQRKRPHSVDQTVAATTTTTNPPSQEQSVFFPAMGLGLGSLPTTFGGQSQQSSNTIDLPVKDPSVAKWEKHTKGIGSKLLAKMGWKGTGGLGSNRRTHIQPIDDGSQKPKHQGMDGTSHDTSSTTASSIFASVTSTTTTRPASTTEPIVPKVKKGISRPVEVVVRPANLGLGFGNFKEATQLKTNRQIEAEVRGIDLEAEQQKKKRQRRDNGSTDFLEDGFDDDDDDDGNDYGPSRFSSAIPSTNDLLSSRSWKRSRTTNKKLKKSQTPKVIPYQELLQQQKQKQAAGTTVIIDMRGPNYQTPQVLQQQQQHNKIDTPTTVPLGEELLYNLSFLLNTYENKLHSSAIFAKSTQQKVTSIETDITDLEQRYQTTQQRLQKMQTALHIVQSVQSVVDRGEDNMQEKVQELLWQLERQFTKEDQEALQFWTVLAPTVLSPAMESTLQQWNPLDGSKDGFATSKSIIDSFFEWSLETKRTNQTNRNNLRFLCESLIVNQLLPKLKHVLESTKWNPVVQTDIALDVYEYLHKKCQHFDNSGRVGVVAAATNVGETQNDNVHVLPSMDLDDPDQGENSSLLTESVHKDLILDTVYPKLQTAISHSKPDMSPLLLQANVVQDRLDTWVLPWIPHLDRPALLPNLLADCKRKVKSTVAYLQRRIGDDKEFVTTCLAVLKPWQGVFDNKSLQRMMEENHVTSRLSRYLSKDVTVASTASDQDWSGLQLVFTLHAKALLSDIEFLSMMEADVLTRWARRAFRLLETSTGAEVVDNYCEWKRHLLVDPGVSAKINLHRSLTLLRNDTMICRIMYSVLMMAQLASQGCDGIAKLADLEPERLGYHSVLARRSLEEKQKVQEAFVKMDSTSLGETAARIRLQRRNVAEPTFRDVVEELARERDIVFQPRMGANATKDGKQVFLFGDLPMFMEDDVVFCYIESSWKPISLDLLVERASKS
ncbi:GC-rich sequence DNA-binding factor-like protein [Nitzschia inconspicua]|uniref:GC-rich sequence DNA-binding factor-like protein n=1 Tax=Nitzschia inconspicua TaxID=303405 RepID=A0A9K3KVL0_9STRA|nr:GC-rich sequence DNA-binding factor-like protein [Nitzschia inconspicua]